MKKLLFVFSALALVLGSCSKSDSTAPVVDSTSVTLPGDVLISKIIESYVAGVVANTTTFTYNGKKILKFEDTNGLKVSFTYSGDNITKKETYNNNVLSNTEDFAYDTSNRVLKYTQTIAGSTPTIENYIYDSTDPTTIQLNNLVSGTTYNFGSSFEGTITVANNQATEISYRYDLSSSSSLYIRKKNSYIFDGKNSFYKNITGFKNIAFAGVRNLNTGYDNNIKQQVKFYNNTQTALTTTATTNWLYVYNTNDFPASCTKTAISTSGNTTTSNITYVY